MFPPFLLLHRPVLLDKATFAMTDAALSVGRGISSLIRVPEKVKKKKTVSSIAAWRPEKKKKKTYLFRPRQIFPEGFPKRNNRDFHAENMKLFVAASFNDILNA